MWTLLVSIKQYSHILPGAFFGPISNLILLQGICWHCHHSDGHSSGSFGHRAQSLALHVTRIAQVYQSCSYKFNPSLGKDRASGQDAKFPFAVRLFPAPSGGRSGCGLCWELGMSGWSLSRICPLCSRTPSLSIPGSLCLYLLRYYFSITCGANRLFD